MKKLIIMAVGVISFTSCVAVKEYEKVNLNDPDMALSRKKSDSLKEIFKSIEKELLGLMAESLAVAVGVTSHF